jgi:CobQ-like glutamine amidotransferase family enzyme
MTDQINKGNASVEYCPTGQMLGDYFTKPLQGQKFIEFRKAILGEE